MSGTVAAPTTAARLIEWGPIIVSVTVLAIFLAAMVVAWFTKAPSLDILLGMAGANAGTACGYWLGSSRDSAKKTEIMASKL